MKISQTDLVYAEECLERLAEHLEEWLDDAHQSVEGDKDETRSKTMLALIRDMYREGVDETLDRIREAHENGTELIPPDTKPPSPERLAKLRAKAEKALKELRDLGVNTKALGLE